MNPDELVMQKKNGRFFKSKKHLPRRYLINRYPMEQVLCIIQYIKMNMVQPLNDASPLSVGKHIAL